MGTVRIERIEDTAGFEKLRAEWNDLLRHSASDCLFLTWEWLFSWWKHLAAGRTLRLLTLREGGSLMAIAPLALRPPQLTRITPFHTLEFLGSGIAGSDYLDFIVRTGKERAACRALANHLRHEKLMLELTQLRRHSCAAETFAAELERGGWSLSKAKTDVCPFIKLSGHSWPSYLATLGSDHRYNFGRRLKNLKKQFEVRFEQVHTEKERREVLPLLIELHNLRWRNRDFSEAFCTANLVSLHDELSRLALEQGWLRLFVLRLDGKPAASLYGFSYHGVFYYFQAGFDPFYSRYSVGLVTMGLAIQSATEEGVEEYDLLHGGEPYKFHWAREAYELGRLELYPPGVSGWLYKGAFGVSRAARRMARHVLPKVVADRLAHGQALSLGNTRHVAATR